MRQVYMQHLSRGGDQSCLQNTDTDLVGLCHRAQDAGWAPWGGEGGGGGEGRVGAGGRKLELC